MVLFVTQGGPFLLPPLPPLIDQSYTCHIPNLSCTPLFFLSTLLNFSSTTCLVLLHFIVLYDLYVTTKPIFYTNITYLIKVDKIIPQQIVLNRLKWNVISYTSGSMNSKPHWHIFFKTFPKKSYTFFLKFTMNFLQQLSGTLF